MLGAQNDKTASSSASISQSLTTTKDGSSVLVVLCVDDPGNVWSPAATSVSDGTNAYALIGSEATTVSETKFALFFRSGVKAGAYTLAATLGSTPNAVGIFLIELTSSTGGRVYPGYSEGHQAASGASSASDSASTSRSYGEQFQFFLAVVGSTVQGAALTGGTDIFSSTVLGNINFQCGWATKPAGTAVGPTMTFNWGSSTLAYAWGFNLFSEVPGITTSPPGALSGVIGQSAAVSTRSGNALPQDLAIYGIPGASLVLVGIMGPFNTLYTLSDGVNSYVKVASKETGSSLQDFFQLYAGTITQGGDLVLRITPPSGTNAYSWVAIVISGGGLTPIVNADGFSASEGGNYAGASVSTSAFTLLVGFVGTFLGLGLESFTNGSNTTLLLNDGTNASYACAGYVINPAASLPPGTYTLNGALTTDPPDDFVSASVAVSSGSSPSADTPGRWHGIRPWTSNGQPSRRVRFY